METGLLDVLGRRVRELRREQGLTRQALSRRAGLSVRFLARVEAGSGNISILKLDALARALGSTAGELVEAERDATGVVALVGLRGAGKSTVGPLLARRLGLPFIEMDRLIVEAAGLSLDEIFELHGEPHWRRLEQEALRQVLARREPAVLAAAGGVVNDPTTWSVLCRGAFVVWLRASAQDHWARVVAQGDHRPMADHPQAQEALRALLDARAAIYAGAALTVDTSRRAPEDVVSEIARRLPPGLQRS